MDGFHLKLSFIFIWYVHNTVSLYNTSIHSMLMMTLSYLYGYHPSFIIVKVPILASIVYEYFPLYINHIRANIHLKLYMWSKWPLSSQGVGYSI